MTETLTIKFELGDKGAEGVRRMADEMGHPPSELAQGMVCLAGLEWLDNEEFREWWNDDEIPPMVKEQAKRALD